MDRVFSKEAVSTLTKIAWGWPLLVITAFPSMVSLSKAALGDLHNSRTDTNSIQNLSPQL
jgi:hypothetical protein